MAGAGEAAELRALPGTNRGKDFECYSGDAKLFENSVQILRTNLEPEKPAVTGHIFLKGSSRP